MSQITFKRPDGQDCAGYLVEPKAGSSAPGVVVIQEWWGVNDQIKGVAARYASLGYRALIPDLYRGKVGLDAKEAEHLMTGLNFGDPRDSLVALLHIQEWAGTHKEQLGRK